MIQLTDSQEAMFWSHIQVSGSCWLWTGPTDSQGYGVYYFDGEQYLAARVAFWLHTGMECDDGVGLTCGRRLCCQPQHSRRRGR